MTTITWNIVNMERIVGDDFVIIAHWTCTASEAGSSYQVYGSESFEYNPNQPGFIPFNELTESIVIGWVHTNIGSTGVSSIESSVIEQLDREMNPVVTVGLPWNATQNPSSFSLPQSPIAPDPVPEASGEI